jgi:hypothetical protein
LRPCAIVTFGPLRHAGDFVKAGITLPFLGSFRNLETLYLVRPYRAFDAINSFMPVFTSNHNALQGTIPEAA